MLVLIIERLTLTPASWVKPVIIVFQLGRCMYGVLVLSHGKI